jgi:hypothetical protein
MRSEINIHVQFHGNERVLRLVKVEGEWHASLIVPGEPDFLTNECFDPAPPGTKLPIIELRDFDLRIELPKASVVSMEMGKLLVSRGVSVEDGWIGVALTSVMADFHDDIGLRHGKSSPGEWGKILDFYGSSGAHQSRQNEDRGIENAIAGKPSEQRMGRTKPLPEKLEEMLNRQADQIAKTPEMEKDQGIEQ